MDQRAYLKCQMKLLKNGFQLELKIIAKLIAAHNFILYWDSCLLQVISDKFLVTLIISFNIDEGGYFKSLVLDYCLRISCITQQDNPVLSIKCFLSLISQKKSKICFNSFPGLIGSSTRLPNMMLSLRTIDKRDKVCQSNKKQFWF